jgi:hypothetical protein
MTHRSADRADVVASNGRIHQELLTVLKGSPPKGSH